MERLTTSVIWLLLALSILNAKANDVPRQNEDDTMRYSNHAALDYCRDRQSKGNWENSNQWKSKTHGEERIFIDDEKIVIKRFFHLTRNKDVIYFQDIIDVVPTTGVVGSLLGYAYNPDMITIISRSKARFHDRVTQCGINFSTEEQTAFIAIIKGLVDKKIE